MYWMHRFRSCHAASRSFRQLQAESLENRRLLAADAFEPNDSLETATDLGTGDQTHNELSIHEAGNDDWYRWTSSADGELNLEILFTESSGDLDLQLYDDQGELLEEANSVTDNEQIVRGVVADGVYFVRVLGFAGELQPDYSLRINGPEPQPDEFESNNEIVEATVVPVGDQSLEQLNIHASDDVDLFRWMAIADGSLTIDVVFQHDLGDVNADLLDANQNLVRSSASDTDNESISLEVSAGQVYYLRVFGVDGAVQRTYDLTFDGPEPGPDSFEPNNDAATASDLVAGDQTHKELTIHEAGGSDWFFWTASASGTVIANATFEHNLGDLTLEILNEDLGLVSRSASDTDNERATAQVSSGQSYFIRVFGESGAFQESYTLSIDGPNPLIDRFESNDTFETAVEPGQGDTVENGLTIHDAGDDDWFKWTAFTGGDITIDLLFPHAFGDLALEFYDSGRNLVASSQTATDNEQVMATVQAGKKYVVHVFGVNGDLHPGYSLSIDGPEILPDAFEPNDNMSNAADLGSGDQSHEGLTIHEGSDEDWFEWTPSLDGPLVVDFLFKSSLGDIDVELFDADNQLLTSSSSFGDNEQLEYDVFAGESYFIHVAAFGLAVQPDYDLVINGPEIQPDENEPNNQLEDAVDIGQGDQIIESQTVHENGDEDWFLWQPIADGSLTLDLLFSNQNGNLDLQLINEAGELLAESTSETDDEQIEWDVLAADRYLFRVFSSSPGTHRSYDLMIDGPGPPLDEYEPNNTFEDAASIGSNDTKKKGLTIQAPGDEDWFSWIALTDSVVDFDVLFSQAAGDLNLELYDSTETKIGESFTSTDNERITSVVRGGQTYYLRAFGAAGATLERYDLVVSSQGPAQDLYEPNDTRDEAHDLGSTDRHLENVTIHTAGDEDWFKITTPAMGSLSVVAVFEHSLGNVDLELQDASGQTLAVSDSLDDQERIAIDAAAGEMFFLRAFGPGSTIQEDYEIFVDVNSSPTIDGPDAVSILEDVTSDPIAIVIGDDETEASELTVTVSSDNPDLIASGKIVVSGVGAERTLTITPEQNETGLATVIVSVSDADKAVGEFRLPVTVTPSADPPVIVAPISDVKVTEDSEPSTVELGPAFGDPDAGNTLVFSVQRNTNPGLVTTSIAGSSLRLRYAADETGNAEITIRANDSTGLFVDQSFDVNVLPVNDAPVVTVPGPQTMNQGDSLTFSTATANAITVSDIDAEDGNVLAVLSTPNGTLAAVENGDVAITGQDTNSVTIAGRLASIIQSLDGLQFTPGGSVQGDTTLTVTFNDLGNSGSGESKTDTDSVAINVVATNRPPRITSPSTFQLSENTQAVSAVTATDPDSDDLQFAISGGDDLEKFAIGGGTGELTFLSPPDFETPLDRNEDNTYEVEVTVDDGRGGTDTQLIQVVVTDVDEIAPTVEIPPVEPDLRASSVASITFTFSEAVSGFDLSDIRLTRSTDSTEEVDLAGATLISADQMTWTLGNLTALTGPAGIYELSIRPGASIEDLAGNPLGASEPVSWINGPGDVNGDGEFNQFDLIDVLQEGKYLTGELATWSQGDWNGDGVFDQMDVIVAARAQPPHYLQGPFGSIFDV